MCGPRRVGRGCGRQGLLCRVVRDNATDNLRCCPRGCDRPASSSSCSRVLGLRSRCCTKLPRPPERKEVSAGVARWCCELRLAQRRVAGLLGVATGSRFVGLVWNAFVATAAGLARQFSTGESSTTFASRPSPSVLSTAGCPSRRSVLVSQIRQEARQEAGRSSGEVVARGPVPDCRRCARGDRGLHAEIVAARR